MALRYAAPGVALALTGRNAERLRAVAAQVAGRGAEASTACLDVTDTATLERWVREQDDARPLDLVIANAGISAGTGGSGGEDALQVRTLFATNLLGALNTALAVLPRMTARGRGQIALMASLASYAGLPGSPAYCGSKAGLRVYGEALRGAVAASGIEVSVICPGFVRTPMTDVNPFPMPFLMAPEDAARRIQAGLAANKGVIAFPFPLFALVRLVEALPFTVRDRLLRLLPRKPARKA